MSPEEYNNAFKKTIDQQEGAYFGKVMVGLATEALSVIKKRVIETGVDAEGQKFPAYSTKPMLVGGKSFPTDSVRNKVFGKENNKKREWVTLGGSSGLSNYLAISAGTRTGDESLKRLMVLQGGYREWRQLMERQVNHVDFAVSGDMWADISVISSESDHQRGIAIIGAKKESEKQKLSGNTERKGDILDLSDKEIIELEETWKLDMLKVFKENGL